MSGVIFLAFFIANAAWWHNAAVGAVLLLAFLALGGAWIGTRAAPGDHPALRRWLGLWYLLSAVMLVGSAVYVIGAFTAPVAYALVLLAIPLAWLHARYAGRHVSEVHNTELAPVRTPGWIYALAACVLVALAMTYRLLVAAATTDAVASPWTVVSSYAFVLFGLAMLGLIVLWTSGKQRVLAAALTVVALGVFLSVPTTVFPIGAGFDPFIHRAAEQRIADVGFIQPKTPYYIGQYVLVAFFHHAFSLPVGALDFWLLPLLTALLLPFAALNAAVHLLRNRPRVGIALAGLFLLPLGLFAVTTPQGLANLWLLLGVLAAIPHLKRFERPGVFVLMIPALAAVAIHPIAGLPALMFVAYLAADSQDVAKGWQTAARVLRGVIVAVGATLLPLAFILQNVLSGRPAPVQFDPAPLGALLSPLFPPLFHVPFRPFLDFAVFSAWLLGLVLVVLAVIGWKYAERPLRHACAALAAMLAGNALLLSTVVNFSFLIDYERVNYAERLLPLITFALLPLAMIGLEQASERVRKAPRGMRVLCLLVAAAVFTGAWYGAYPRDDAYMKGHGYNVSLADIHAVQLIEQDANGVSYIALANQSVSVAALSSIGYRYYGNQFFYPIPTGGELYELFLDMNADPTRAKALAAMQLVENACRGRGQCEYGNIQSLYYVVDSYWWDAKKIIAAATWTADDWFIVDGGKVTVFRYDREVK